MIARKNTGHGIGLRNQHYSHLLEHGPRGVDWFEVISENFFVPGGRPWAVLDKVRREVPIVLHGVSLGIGNSAPLSDTYISSLAELIERVEPAWVSDHLCWGAHDGRHGHDLWPLPYTEEAIDLVARKVTALQERLKRQILLENVSSYVSFQMSEMPEWQFINAIAERADCGILLDVNNVYVSAKNHGFSAEEYIDSICHARIGQIHLAGHTDCETYLFDTHIGPTPEAVWQLYRRVLARTGPVPTLIEWDEEIPDYETVVAERDRAKRIAEEAS